MKILVLAVVVVVFALLGWLSFQNVEIDRARKPAPPAPVVPKKDFAPLVEVLREDMKRIPATLPAPRVVPSHAFTIKSQLQGVTGQHEEYEVLDRVCDLVIFADQEHSVRQRDYLNGTGGVRPSSMEAAQAGAPLSPEARRAGLQKDQEAAWTAYRQKTEAEVQRLLGMLAGKKL